jgi:hypothetical protein
VLRQEGPRDIAEGKECWQELVQEVGMEGHQISEQLFQVTESVEKPRPRSGEGSYTKRSEYVGDVWIGHCGDGDEDGDGDGDGRVSGYDTASEMPLQHRARPMRLLLLDFSHNFQWTCTTRSSRISTLKKHQQQGDCGAALIPNLLSASSCLATLGGPN